MNTPPVTPTPAIERLEAVLVVSYIGPDSQRETFEMDHRIEDMVGRPRDESKQVPQVRMDANGQPVKDAEGNMVTDQVRQLKWFTSAYDATDLATRIQQIFPGVAARAQRIM